MATHDPQGGLRICMAQANLLVGDIEGNAARVLDMAHEARDRLGAQLAVFPELTLTGYPPEDLLLRPGLYSRVEQALLRIREELSGIAVVLGYPHREDDRVFNASALIRDGRLEGPYLKQLLPNYGVFDEKRYFAPGGSPTVVDVAGVACGLSICEDIWEPGPAQAAVAAGAALILNINASPYHTGKGTERESTVTELAGTIGVPIVYVNLVGGQDELVFDGGSFAVNPDGGLAFQAPSFREGLFPVDVRLGRAVHLNKGEIAPHLPHEASVYEALVLGVGDYIKKNQFRGAVVGLSGGIDSALTVAIAVDALGPERVLAVLMPSRYTAPMSVEDARLEAEALGVKYHSVPIEAPFQAFLDVLAQPLAGTSPDTTEENIQARCRGVILMALSNKLGKMVLTTGNKSEMAVGYATLYGDMAGGFAPLKDVPKMEVYRLAEWRNRRSPVIPRRVLERPPSAELAPDQEDEDSLPPYPILDTILELYIEQDICAEDIVARGFDPETVARVVRLVNRNEYKRRQAAPGVRVTRRAFGRDRRYPITSGYDR